jgi:hypothetical protein
MLVLSMLLPATAPASPGASGKTPELEACAHAQYRLDSDPAGVGPQATLEMGGVIALGDACPPVAPKRWKARKNGATLVAARWPRCAGLTGAVRLQGRLVDGCRRFRGTIEIGKRRRPVDGTRIECGEGCASARSTADTVVGEVDGGRALIAIVRDADRRVTANACGVGADAKARTAWLRRRQRRRRWDPPSRAPTAWSSRDASIVAARTGRSPSRRARASLEG